MQNLDRPRRHLALALAGLAGFVDAAGYLSADRYFVSFMSGNTTRLGVELAREPAAAVFPALLAISFVAGVLAGALLSGRIPGRHKPPLLAGVATGLAFAAWLFGAGDGRAALIVLAAAMGALNNSFQSGGKVSVGITYMTGALVKLGQGLAALLQRRTADPWGDWLLLWIALACGATLGALAFVNWPGVALWIAAIVAAVLSLAARALPGGAP
ncbi:YoaK family protein [Novosphingobium sp.]|uniref:YoaK family protein n=1 Tax=Novosphingobium sp. TaxID=1874826 RepID=UPI002869ECD9|nr:YoaK family protein [Novosphingobium sp.]